MSYCPQFWGSRAIYIFLTGMTKKSSFLLFMTVSMTYCPQFRGSRAIYMFERYNQKLIVFAFYGRFNELLPKVLGFQGDLHVLELWPKTRLFCVLWTFSWVIVHSFGVPGWFRCLGGMSKNLSFCVLWLFSWVIAHGFGVPGRFTCFRGMTRNSSF